MHGLQRKAFVCAGSRCARLRASSPGRTGQRFLFFKILREEDVNLSGSYDLDASTFKKRKKPSADALSGGLADTFEKLGAMPGYEGTNLYN